MTDGKNNHLDLIEYWIKVMNAARRRKGEQIYNYDTAHAQVVIESLLRAATSRLNILSGALHPGVYSDDRTLDALEEFLRDKNSSARVLVESEPKDGWLEHPFVQRAIQSGQVQFRKVSEADRQRYRFHFTTMDGDSFRFEPDRREHSAIAVFGDAEKTQNLDDIFDSLWAVSSTVNVPTKNAQTA